MQIKMIWNELTLNPKVILGYYEQAPSLRNVRVHRISLLQDGPMAEVVFEPDKFPKNPSSKWPAGANTCQIVIRAIGLSEVEILGWGSNVVGDLEIIAVPNGVELSFLGEGQFRFVCSHFDVASVLGYISERS